MALAACSPHKAADAQSDAASAELEFFMQPAFAAAFGSIPPAPHEVQRQGKPVVLQFQPKVLADIGEGHLALVSTAVPPADDCEMCGGAVAVHYLVRTSDGGFKVTGQWFDLDSPDPLDGPPELRLRQGLFARPALQIELPRRDKGCESAAAQLFEFTPSGPVLRARDIVTRRNNIPMGGLRTGPQVDYFGNILPDAKGVGFKAHYHGSTEGDVIWRPSPSGLQPQPGSFRPPEC